MKTLRYVVLALAMFVAAPATARAQDDGPKRITMREALLLPAWGGYSLSPDNSMLLFTKRETDPEEWESETHVWVHDLRSGTTRQLTNGASGESNPRWLPDGRVLFSAERGEDDDAEQRYWVIAVDGGEARPFFEDEEAPSSGSFNNDYSMVAYAEESDRADEEEWEERKKQRDDAYYAEHKLTWTHIWTYDATSGEKIQITDGEYDHQGPQWSPDGSWIAFTSNRTQTQMGDPDRSDNTDVLIVPATGGEPRNLTAGNPGADRGPAWSPNGGQIAYTASLIENQSAAQGDVFVVDVASGTPRNLTADLDRSASGVQWSADGERIYFTVADGLTSHLYHVSASGGRPEPVLPDDAYLYGGFSLSDDGTMMVFTGSSLDVPGDVFVANSDGSNVRRVMSPTEDMAGFELARSETLSWEGADGWEIEGVLTYPVGYVEGQRYPTILQVHGGPHGRYSKGFDSGSQIWAARGYAVLRGNPRGSSGRSFEFSNANYMDWGGKDFEDLMAGVDRVIEMGVADEDRLAIMGGSYGGFMTFWSITQTDRFKAAVGHAAISDWFAFYGQTDIPFLLEFGFGGLPWETKETFERFSPIEFAENVTTPLLITHGEQDLRVPITQGEQYFRTLKKMGQDVEFLRFPREGHGIREPRHRLYLDEEQARWFERWVQGTRSVTDH